jgi:hypothetical protein
MRRHASLEIPLAFPPVVAKVVTPARLRSEKDNMNPQSRPFAYPTVSPSPVVQSSPRRGAVAIAIPFDLNADSASMEQRWKEWKARGRREDAAFRETTRTIGLAVSAAAILVLGLMWIIAG